MTEKIGDIILIYPENEQECDDCGKVAELRPYGPNGSKICYDCAMKDPIGTEIRLHKELFGDDISEERAKLYLIKSGRIKPDES